MFCYDKHGRRLNPAQSINCLNFYAFFLTICLYLQAVNSNTTNMNRHGDRNFNINLNFNSQQSNSHKEDFKIHDDTRTVDKNVFGKFNLEKNPYYSTDGFVSNKYSTENNAYSNYEDYKRYYLNPSNPVPRSRVKFKISSKIIQTKYGKLQGIVLAMDEHRYLSPLEVFLGVPYATPPVGSNR
ncbi:unnamed protein product [Parnassius mnemosyne]|uniref:Carboxylesterase type B domain-containing protein n=1 Tax=Parnassius mnemosyne TaxID=213953 RepID=A0AAV1LYB6_9NEOP